jgi:hypothetical protein
MAEERDFILARLAAARGHLAAATDALDNCINFWIWPDEDKGGKERADLLDVVSEAAGELSRAAEAAQTAMEGLSKDELKAEEPDLPEGDEFDENPVTAED